VLSGANTYSGGTAIASGATLQIGNGNNNGSIVGNVLDNGTLKFYRFDSSVSRIPFPVPATSCRPASARPD